jgi:ribosomal protein S4
MSTETIKNKRRYKPLYKKFHHIFENVQFKKKLFKFKKKKWIKLIRFTQKQIYYKNYNIMIKSSNPNIRFAHKPIFKKNYNFLLKSAKKLNLYYGGGYRKKYFQHLVKQIQKTKLPRFGTNKNYIEKDTYLFIEHMEKRLESVIRRAFFFDSITKIRQMINHGHVYVNKQTIKNEAFLVKEFDLIEISYTFKTDIKRNIKHLSSYLIPTPTQTNLLVNYKTFQIYYTGKKINLGEYIKLFPIIININKLINFYRYK